MVGGRDGLDANRRVCARAPLVCSKMCSCFPGVGLRCVGSRGMPLGLSGYTGRVLCEPVASTSARMVSGRGGFGLVADSGWDAGYGVHACVRGCALRAQRAGFSSNDIRRWLNHQLTVVNVSSGHVADGGVCSRRVRNVQ